MEQGVFCLLSPAITVQLQRCTETRRRCEMGRKEMWDKFIPPKADLAFRELMRNEEIRRHFISDVLGISLEDIRSVRLENTFFKQAQPTGKAMYSGCQNASQRQEKNQCGTADQETGLLGQAQPVLSG